MLCVFLISGGLWAQQTSVAGTVTDESGLPLPGATIIVENTNRGVTTDFDGNYSIEAQAGEVLLVSYVGYTTQRITSGSTMSFSFASGDYDEEVTYNIVYTALDGSDEQVALSDGPSPAVGEKILSIC